MAGKFRKKEKRSRDRKECSSPLYSEHHGTVDEEEQNNVVEHHCMCLCPPRKRKKSFREMIFEEIFEEALKRSKRAPVQQRVFTSKELAALALMKSDSQEDSDDGDSICYDYPSTSNPDQVAHSSHKSVSPTGSGISLSPARPDLRHEGEEGTAVVQSEAADQLIRLEQRMDILESKVDHVIELLTNTGSDSELEPEETTLAPEAMATLLPNVEEVKGDTKDIPSKLMKLRGHNPGKYAIALMDELFTPEEMASSNYMSSTRCSKPSLDEHRRHLIEECIDKRFGEGTAEACQSALKYKCNKKCSNIAWKLRKEKFIRTPVRIIS